ncbi:TPA: stationary-phase-induced ribosome-associated protein [Yersinia enterocolitica]
MSSNREARRVLGMPHKLSQSKPWADIWLFNVPTEGRWQLPDHLRSHDIVAVKYKPYLLAGMVCDGYRFYPAEAFYPAYVKKG